MVFLEIYGSLDNLSRIASLDTRNGKVSRCPSSVLLQDMSYLRRMASVPDGRLLDSQTFENIECPANSVALFLEQGYCRESKLPFKKPATPIQQLTQRRSRRSTLMTSKREDTENLRV